MRRPAYDRTVSGHADKAIAERRKADAVALAAQGHDYESIAREVGYTNRGTAWRTVMNALTEHTAEAVEELRAVEVARLDALQAGLWPEAMAGNVAAANAIVRIIEQRRRLLGLGQASGSTPQARTVVVTD